MCSRIANGVSRLRSLEVNDPEGPFALARQNKGTHPDVIFALARRDSQAPRYKGRKRSKERERRVWGALPSPLRTFAEKETVQPRTIRSRASARKREYTQSKKRRSALRVRRQWKRVFCRALEAPLRGVLSSYENGPTRSAPYTY